MRHLPFLFCVLLLIASAAGCENVPEALTIVDPSYSHLQPPDAPAADPAPPAVASVPVPID